MSLSVLVVGLAMALTVQVPPPRAAAAESAELQSAWQAITEQEAEKLKKLASRLDADGRRAEAEAVLRRIEPPTPEQGPVRFMPLPEVVSKPRTQGQGLANVPAEKPGAELATIQNTAARSLYDLAVRALAGKLKHYSLADECLRAVLDRDPDHAEARRLLGYVAYLDGWATPFAVEQIKSGKVLHSTYGWVDASWVPHLEQGELPAPGVTNPKDARWLPAAEADALRGTIKQGWKIKTEHFEIFTDVPLSEAIAFGRKLESFHDLFFSLLADVIAEDLPLARRFRDKAKALPTPAPHTVYYFATKQEYVEFLLTSEGPTIEETLGLYNPPSRPNSRRSPAFFFRDPGGALDVSATLFHEVSHQLLFESTSALPSAYKKNVGNFWVFEGLGTYFETVTTEDDGSFQVGGFVGPRIEVAQIRQIERNEHVPVLQLVKLTQNGFKDPEKVHLNYAEAMALTVFLMHGRGGQYREDFLDYVRDALRGRLKGAGALDDRLGVDYKTLDSEFLAALRPRS